MKTSYRPSLPERLLGLLFPPRCLTCGELVAVGRLFCPNCQDGLPAEPLRRALPLEDGGTLPVASVLPYEGGFRKTLHALKFQGQKSLAKPIGMLMAEAAGTYQEQFDCVAYVSMYPADRRKQGFDHAQLLAEHTAAELGLPLWDGLEKTRRTNTQHTLDAKGRRENLRGAYRAQDVAGKAVLLVDDIVTTGSSLTECARALRAAGAGTVCALCAADTELKPKEEGDATHGHGKDRAGRA